MVKNLPAVLETRVCSLGWEDPLEEGTATYSSILAWRVRWTEEPGRLQSSTGFRRQESDTTERLTNVIFEDLVLCLLAFMKNCIF